MTPTCTSSFSSAPGFRFDQGRVAVPWVAGVVVWLLVGVSVAHWALRWVDHAPPVALPVAPDGPVKVDAASLALALGAGQATETPEATAAPVPARFVLHGVATDAQGRGVALLAANGEPVVPVRVGDALPGGWVLASLAADRARLSPVAGGAVVTVLLRPPGG